MSRCLSLLGELGGTAGLPGTACTLLSRHRRTSRTLLEELQFDRSRVTSVDWVTYPILKFPDVPEVAVDLIDRPTEKPWGAGEPASAVVPAAIANAIFDATGVRLRSIPITPTKVLAALRASLNMRASH